MSAQVHIELEDEFAAYDFSEFTVEDLAQIDKEIAFRDSPFRKFLARKKYLAVTDIVAPLWCEVQHEYNLYGRRHKPLHLRPSSFTSRNGNTIRVHQQVARTNDRRLKRGKSVHRALEVELRPDALVVHPVSEEERFGLRLLQLIDGFDQLVSTGITRELPVFTITHAQVVLGVIDEVRTRCHNPSEPLAIPLSSPPKKKQRLTEIAPPAVSGQQLELHILDYKTRHSHTIPLDNDSLAPRIQLMMYHRMLSALLQPETFSFDLLWSQLNLNPTKPFSDKFVKDIVWEHRQVDSADRNVHLNRLVSEWMSTLRRNPCLLKVVSRRLQIVYRHSVDAKRQTSKGKNNATVAVDVDDHLQALELDEEVDIARAIEQSIKEMGQQDAGQPIHPDQSPAVHSSSNSSPADLAIAWAIQQSLAGQVPAHATANAETSKLRYRCCQDETQRNVSQDHRPIAEISPIIGMKEFDMDDDELDAQLASVLQWWLGMRPAKGVDIGQTNRCCTCEYRDSCEWRERMAADVI